MYLIIKKTKTTTTSLEHNEVTACPDGESLQDYILRHGISSSKVYRAVEIEINITAQAKKKGQIEDVPLS